MSASSAAFTVTVRAVAQSVGVKVSAAEDASVRSASPPEAIEGVTVTFADGAP